MCSARCIGEIQVHVEEAARRAWLEYPHLLSEECQRQSVVLEERSRHPRYRFAQGFLLLHVKKETKTVIAILSDTERKLGRFPADVQTVVERVRKEELRLFGRGYDGTKLLSTIRQHYSMLLQERGEPDGSLVLLRDLARRLIKGRQGYQIDEFLLDFSRLAREGPFEIDGRRLQLRETRDDKTGMLLHNVGSLGYIGSLSFTVR